MRLAHLGHAFGAFGSCVWRIWVMRLEHLGQAHWHSLDLRGGTAQVKKIECKGVQAHRYVRKSGSGSVLGLSLSLSRC